MTTAIREAILAGAAGDELANLPIPESYRASFVRRDEVDMFDGVSEVQVCREWNLSRKHNND